MRKSKSVFLILLSLIMLLSACSVSAPIKNIEAPEPTVVETEPTTVHTEVETIPVETKPEPMEITDFVLETVDGENFYTMNGFSYPAHLGAPELGLEGTAALYQEGDAEAAVKDVNSIADAICYVSAMEDFTDSRAVCEVFAHLLEDNYNFRKPELGYIHLQGEELDYCLFYVQKDNVFYPVDVFHVAQGLPSWILDPENGCTPSEDAYALCENLANTFPDGDVKTWVMEPANPYLGFTSITKYEYPWQLRGAVLGPEKVRELVEAGDQYAADRAITTVEDAITYLQMMDPKTRDPHSMKTFIYLIADDYEDVGLINLMKRKPEHREGFYDESAYFGGYFICYVKKDGIYYPVDYHNILQNWPSWTLLPGNDCYSSDNLDDLCKRMGATFPYHQDGSKLYYWETSSYMYHRGVKLIPVSEYLIPEALGHPVLSDEEIDELVQETDYEIIAEKITTLGDALHFYDKLRLVQPKHPKNNPHYPFEYFQSAWQALKDKTAGGFTTCSLTRYLLKEDYDEVGYIFAQATNASSDFMYIYEDGLYYLLQAGEYSIDPRPYLWIEWPDVIGCAEDFQTIADSMVEHCWFMAPNLCEQVKYVYRIKCEGDFIIGAVDQEGHRIFPVGAEVTAYYAPEVFYEEATLDWQSQTRIDY